MALYTRIMQSMLHAGRQFCKC